jgi:multicomponent Na+:H+ antiporter subunit E
MLAYIRVILVSWVLYLAVTGNLELSNLAVGLAIGVVIALIMQPRSQPLPLRSLPIALFNLVRYVVWLAIDILRNGVRVARIVLDPRLPIRPGIIAIPAGTRSKVGLALSAHAITVTPGEQVIEIGDDGVMYTHCLNAVTSAEGAEEAQRVRREMLEKIFE